MSQKLFYHPILGGEDLVSPPMAVSPERCAVALNYECDMNGRLRRVDGYERFDGRTAPSSEKDPVAREAARSAIGPVPGHGPVRGVWSYKGDKYAIRDTAAHDKAILYKATASGWVEVNTPTLAGGGQWSFDTYNFLGTAGGEKMYGANGTGKAIEFDGTTLVHIDTQSTPDLPKFVKGHKLHLVISGMPDGQLHVSGLKNPTSFAVADGASIYGVGDNIGETITLPGGSLALIARNSTHILYGSSTATSDPWRIEPHSINTGGIPYTAQYIGGMAMYLDDRGLTTLSATQRFGNFSEGTISKPVKPFYDARIGKAVCSTICREKSLYRLFFNDGCISNVSVYGGNTAWFTRSLLPVKAYCCCSVENASGVEEVFFGGEDGYVYQMDRGTSFDGRSILAKVQQHYNFLGSPRHKKRVLKVVLEVEAAQRIIISFNARYNNAYGTSVDTPNTFKISGGGGYWNESLWGEFIWFTQNIASVSAYLNGTGLSCGLSFSSNSADETPHIIQGLTYHYIERGLQR